MRFSRDKGSKSDLGAPVNFAKYKLKRLMRYTSTKCILLLIPIAFTGGASAQTMEPWLLPDPGEMISASNTLCSDQTKSALLAWNYKRQGRTKEEILGLIPESPKSLALRVTSAMRESVEDAYRFPELSPDVHYSFRSEVCMRETLGAVRMPRMETIYPRIAECQKVHGPDKSDSLFKCVQSIVRSVVPKLQ